MSAFVAYLQRYDDRYAHLAGAIGFCVLAAVMGTLLIHARRHRELLLSEAAAPLFGRELARARALVPCAMATCAAAAYWALSAFYARPAASDVVLTLTCGYAAGMLALPGAISRSAAAPFFGVIALCGMTFALAGYPAAAIAIAAVAAYVALRQYGEALTRFDTI
jgi:hypothetical protein